MFTVKFMSVSVNGIIYEESDDYTYDSNEGKLSFHNKLYPESKVTVTLTYLNNSANVISDIDNTPYEKTKLFDEFESSVELNTSTFSSFILDFRTNPPTNLNIVISNILNEYSIGKSIILTLIFGDTVPVISWGNNVAWKNASAPSFESNYTYVIHLTKMYLGIKYIAMDINKVLTRKFMNLKKKYPTSGEINIASTEMVSSGNDDEDEYLVGMYMTGLNIMLKEAADHFNVSLNNTTYTDLQSMSNNPSNSIGGLTNQMVIAYEYIVLDKMINNVNLSNSQALSRANSDPEISNYYYSENDISDTNTYLIFLFSPATDVLAKNAALNYNVTDFYTLRDNGSLTYHNVLKYYLMTYNNLSDQEAEDDIVNRGYEDILFEICDIGGEVMKYFTDSSSSSHDFVLEDYNFWLESIEYYSMYPNGSIAYTQYGTDLGFGNSINTIRSDAFSEGWFNPGSSYEEVYNTPYDNSHVRPWDGNNYRSKGEFCILDFDGLSGYAPQYVLVSTFDFTRNGLLFKNANIEINSNNVRRCQRNKYLDFWASYIGDSSVDCYEFTNTTIRDALITYFINANNQDLNNESWIPVQVVMH